MSKRVRESVETVCDQCIHCTLSAEKSPVLCRENQEDEHPHVFCTIKRSFTHPGICGSYIPRIVRDKERLKKRLTHSGMIQACAEYAKSKGWNSARVSDFTDMPSGTGGIPDIILYEGSGDGLRLAIEVKPSGCSWDEIKRGIGQCAYYLLYGVQSSYLVCPDVYEEELLLIFKKLSCIGLITFDSMGKLKEVFGKPL